jgi:lysozyme
LIFLLFICLFLVACERQGENEFPVRGIDVSAHQGEIKWQNLKENGIQFSYIKATEGADFRDAQFVKNWNGARQNGIIPGAYHYFTFCSKGDLQAMHFLKNIPSSQNALPPAVDVEYGGNCKNRPSDEQIRQELQSFIDVVELKTQRKILIYTTLTAYFDFIKMTSSENEIWIRNTWMRPVLPGEHKWKIWQNEVKSFDGLVGPYDRNVFNGSSEEFAEWMKKR